MKKIPVCSLHDIVQRHKSNGSIKCLEAMREGIIETIDRVSDRIDTLMDKGVSAPIEHNCRAQAQANMIVIQNAIDELLALKK